MVEGGLKKKGSLANFGSYPYANFGECAQGATFGGVAHQSFSVKVNYSDMCIRPSAKVTGLKLTKV